MILLFGLLAQACLGYLHLLVPFPASPGITDWPCESGSVSLPETQFLMLGVSSSESFYRPPLHALWAS